MLLLLATDRKNQIKHLNVRGEKKKKKMRVQVSGFKVDKLAYQKEKIPAKTDRNRFFLIRPDISRT